MDVQKKEEFKQRFGSFDVEELIEHSFMPLTDEALEATLELLQERGLSGEKLQLRSNAVRKDILSRAGGTDRCDYCGGAISFNAFRSGKQLFCSERCRSDSALLIKSIDLAPDLIYEQAVRMKFGECPECGVAGNGVEMHTTHHVVSVLLFARYFSKSELRCITCAQKASRRAAVGCLCFGWWSLSGLFATPVLIFRNLRVARASELDEEPSAQLLLRARLELARNVPDFSDLRSDYPFGGHA